MVSEGSLSPTVAGNFGTEQSRRGGKGRVERGARTRAVGKGPDNSLDERIGYGDVTWRESGEDVGSRGKEYFGDNTKGLA